MTKKTTDVTFTVKVPKEWHDMKLNFTYVAYLLNFEEYVLNGTPSTGHTAEMTRVSMTKPTYEKYFLPLIDIYGSKVKAVNAIFQFISVNPRYNKYKMEI